MGYLHFTPISRKSNNNRSTTRNWSHSVKIIKVVKWVLFRHDAGRRIHGHTFSTCNYITTGAREPPCKTKTKNRKTKYAIEQESNNIQSNTEGQRIKHKKGFQWISDSGGGRELYYRRRHQQRHRQQRRRRHGLSSYPLPLTVENEKVPLFFFFFFFSFCFDSVRVFLGLVYVRLKKAKNMYNLIMVTED